MSSRLRTMIVSDPREARSSAKKQFRKYLTSATRNLRVGKDVSQCPSFGTLPMELLEMIANEVAIPNAYEGYMRYTPISKHLFKMRSVCKAFTTASTSVFLRLVDDEGYEEYRTIYLPPKSGDLDLLKTTATHRYSILPDLITNVNYEIVTAKQSEIEEDELIEYFEAIGLADDDPEHSERLSELNVNLFKKQSRRQNHFANQLASATGKRALKATLSSLWNLGIAEVSIMDFWDESSVGLTESASESEAVATIPYRKGIPAFLECLAGSEVTELELFGFGSHAFGGLSPLRTLELASKQPFRHITMLRLYVSHHDDVAYSEFADDGLVEKPLTRSDRVSLLLSRMKHLNHLSLHCEDIPGEVEWLSNVLQDQIWPNLSSFYLYNFNTTSKPLLDFFGRHKKSLAAITLVRINMITDGWVRLLHSLRDDLKLRNASIWLETDSQVAQKPEIAKIIETHGTASEHDIKRVDVGAFVVKPRKIVPYAK